ncbi:MAG: DUF697 domain-containing protein [Cyclobacteriaceae bacterium]
MLKQLRSILLPLSILFILGFLLFLFNQVSQIYLVLLSINTTLAYVVTGLLAATLIFLMVLPVVLFLKLPSPLSPPASLAEVEQFKVRLKKRLASNQFLKQNNIGNESLEEALSALDAEANIRIKKTANTVFLATAISQNGKLDALTVLITQSKLIWDLAHLYYQRPSLRDLSRLYANVGAATFLASQIEEIDISEQMEPIIRSLFKGMTTQSVPLVGNSATIIIDSLLEGSTNAFLSLRVGVIARNYCSGQYFATRKEAKLSAFKEASGMLGAIVVSASKNVIAGIVEATRRTGVKTVKSGIDAVKRTGEKISGQVRKASSRLNPFTTTIKEIPADTPSQ